VHGPIDKNRIVRDVDFRRQFSFRHDLHEQRQASSVESRLPLAVNFEFLQLTSSAGPPPVRIVYRQPSLSGAGLEGSQRLTQQIFFGFDFRILTASARDR
jgi:hypothetical protein